MTDARASGGIRVTGAKVVGGFRVRERASLHPHDDGAHLRQANPKYFSPLQQTALADERAQRDVATRIEYLLELRQWDQVRQFLTSFTFLAARLALGGIGGLLKDFRLSQTLAPMRAYADVRLIHDILAITEPILNVAPSQLPEQLLARLPEGLGERTDLIRKLARHAKQEECWLRPLTSSFTGPGAGLRRVLERHRSFPSALAFSSDGSLLVTADSRELMLWDTQTYELLMTLGGHNEDVTGVVFTTDDRFVVASARAPCLFCWRRSVESLPKRFGGHTGAVLALVSLPDGRVLAGDTGGTLMAWDMERMQAVSIFQFPAPIHSLSLFPGGERCLVAWGHELSGPSHLTVWHLSRRKKSKTIVYKHGEIQRVAVSGDGRFVLVASNQHLLRWELPDWMGPRENGRHEWRVSGLSISNNGRWAVSADTGGGVLAWDCHKKASPRVLNGHRLMVTGAAISPSSQLATTGHDQTVRIWEFPPPAVGPAFSPHQKTITALATWSRRGRHYAISASQDHTLAIFDLDGPRPLFRLKAHSHWVTGVAVIPGVKTAVSVSWDGTIAHWDLRCGKLRRQIRTPDAHLQAVAVDAKGKRVVTAPYEGPIRMWDSASGKVLAAIDTGIGQANCLAFSPDGRRLLVGGKGLAIVEITFKRCRPLGRILFPADQVQAAAFSPDATRCFVATASGKLHVCQLPEGHVIHTWQDSPSGISGLALTLCGQWAVTGGGLPRASSDDTILVWDCQTGRVLARFIGDSPFCCCCFYNDGKRFVVGDSIGRLHLFSVVGVEVFSKVVF